MTNTDDRQGISIGDADIQLTLPLDENLNPQDDFCISLIDPVNIISYQFKISHS